MKWDGHIDKVVNKATKRLFLLRNLRRSNCPVNLMLTCYFSFIRSVLLYGFPSFCNVPKCLFDTLQKVERRALRIIGSSDPHVPPLSVASQNLCSKMMTSVEHFNEHLLRSISTERKPSSTRSSHALATPFAKTERFSKSFIRFCK